MRDVGLGDLLQDVARARPPQTDAGILRGHILQDDRSARSVRHVQTNPRDVVHAERRAGDDKEAIVCQSRHGYIALDAAARVEHLGIDHAAHRPIHSVGAQGLHERQRARTAHFNLVERGLVEQSGSLACADMLVFDGC